LLSAKCRPSDRKLKPGAPPGRTGPHNIIVRCSIGRTPGMVTFVCTVSSSFALV
jgi:hypothetical protein